MLLQPETWQGQAIVKLLNLMSAQIADYCKDHYSVSYKKLLLVICDSHGKLVMIIWTAFKMVWKILSEALRNLQILSFGSR
jgi:hypothetical protein